MPNLFTKVLIYQLFSSCIFRFCNILLLSSGKELYFQFSYFHFSGLPRRSSPTELSLLWRDSQAVQAYLGGQPIIAKLPSPNSWASRTAASCALSGSGYQAGQQPQQPQQPQVSEHHYEEIMELKRQLVHTNQDLHLTKVRLLKYKVSPYAPS